MANPVRLGRYSLVRKLGQGGMGTVYEAVEDGLKRRVALKVLSKELMDDPAYLDRFRREAKAAAVLNHPNIVTVYEIDEDSGYFFYSMEFVDGMSLQKRLDVEGHLSIPEALRILTDVAEALHYAWNRGRVIHRDIKPDNIMLTREGHVKLADLGLAKSLLEQTRVTMTGAAIGSPAYMAPEQARNAKDVDCRADIYSLGITLYQMLTGQWPFQGTSPLAIILAHEDNPLPDPRAINPNIPVSVCRMLRRMCDKKPKNRFQTPEELLAEVRRVSAAWQTPVGGLSDSSELARKGGTSDIQMPESDSTIDIPVVEESAPAPSPGPSSSSASARRRVTPVQAALATAVSLSLLLALSTALSRGKHSSPSEASPQGSSAPPAARSVSPDPNELPVTVADGETAASMGQSAKSDPASSSSPSDGNEAASLLASDPDSSLDDLRSELDRVGRFSKDQPEQFAEILQRLGELRKRSRGTVVEASCGDLIQVWQAKWEAAAKLELAKRDQQAQPLVLSGRLEEAARFWLEFPPGARSPEVSPLIERRLQDLSEQAERLPDQLAVQAEPFLSGSPEELSAESAEALAQIQERGRALLAASDPAASKEAASPSWRSALPEEQRLGLSLLLRQIDTALEARKSALAAQQARAYDDFWELYEKAVRERKFKDALDLIEKNQSAGSPERMRQHERDTRLLQSVFHRAAENLVPLVQQTVRLNGIPMKISSVRNGKLMVRQDQDAEMGFGPEALEADVLWKLGTDAELDAATRTHLRVVFLFFYGQPASTRKAVEDARTANVDIRFFEGKLAELEQGREKVRIEKAAAALVDRIESEIRRNRLDEAGSDLDRLKAEFAGSDASKAGLARLEELLERANTTAAAQKNLARIPAGKSRFITEGLQKDVELSTYFIGKYEVTWREYNLFLQWIEKEAEKGEKGDPHRFCYPGCLPDGRELTDEQFIALDHLPPKKRAAELAELKLQGFEPLNKLHKPTAYAGFSTDSDFPVTGADWYDAWAYCRWAGGRLPTEEEWDKAATWDPKAQQRRTYPWGNELVPKWVNSSSKEDGISVLCAVHELAPGASAYGCLNMAGNVGEWCFAVIGPQRYRIFKGGHYAVTPEFCIPHRREIALPSYRGPYLGFRVFRKTVR
ncbi:MAG: protein kinase [Planctomycetes bacterium]|nr:protein kinase [Planctomycetota bacterium]